MEHDKSESSGTSKPSDPIDDLELLKRRLSEEREKEERKLLAFGRIEAQIDWTLAAYRLAESAGIHLDEERWPGITTLPNAWRSQFDRDFPPADDPADMLHVHIVNNTTSGSVAYTMLVESANQFEQQDVYHEYARIKQGFESVWEAESRTEEVTRRLAWLSEQAAEKFKAAWEALYAGIPSTDPASGPALAMRSALDLTVREALLKRTPEPHPSCKAEYLVHIARHAARSPEAEKGLASQARVYPDLTTRLTKVKGTTGLDRQALRTLFFRAQELLYLIVEVIDPNRLLPKRK
ncbi:MAG TPA: hypothetical protein ENK35_10115 [Candidatus Tenderia sp.]|nr:hypothetical protein [Candidatus Tenderia sp.]